MDKNLKVSYARKYKNAKRNLLIFSFKDLKIISENSINQELRNVKAKELNCL